MYHYVINDPTEYLFTQIVLLGQENIFASKTNFQHKTVHGRTDKYRKTNFKNGRSDLLSTTLIKYVVFFVKQCSVAKYPRLKARNYYNVFSVNETNTD